MVTQRRFERRERVRTARTPNPRAAPFGTGRGSRGPVSAPRRTQGTELVERESIFDREVRVGSGPQQYQGRAPFEFDTQDLSRLVLDLRALGGQVSPGQVRRMFRRFLLARLQQLTPVRTGRLLRSIHVGQQLDVSMVFYGEFVEARRMFIVRAIQLATEDLFAFLSDQAFA